MMGLEWDYCKIGNGFHRLIMGHEKRKYRRYVAVVISILYLDRPRFVSSSQASGPSSAHMCRRRNVRLVYIRSGKLT